MLRIGALGAYEALCAALAQVGEQPIHTVEQHRIASELPGWYPRISALTPQSLWFDAIPWSESELGVIGDRLGWPVFVKGARQTSRHQAGLCIAADADALAVLLRRYQQDPILSWQPVTIRRFLPLRIVDETAPGGLPAAFEFRTFWWRGQLAGAGPYWSSEARFRWSPTERDEALAVAGQAAQRVDVPFLVVDVAQDREGRWWVIECNDAQESSYAGVSPVALWQRIVQLQR